MQQIMSDSATSAVGHQSPCRDILSYLRWAMADLVQISPHPARAFEIREDGAVVRVHLAFNAEQELDRVDIDEGAEEVAVTAWVGWKATARHVQDPALLAGGGKVTFIDLRLGQNLAGRPIRDTASDGTP